ncbi:MAG TPA: hypothetical protein VFQ15_09760 [Jiangellaceae bacterium]|nr:hypothetical protein [Jiangellaceae bacterium]
MANTWDAVAQELQSAPLYVHPEAETELDEQGIPFNDDAQSAVLDSLQGTGSPIYVAVLPAAASDRSGAQSLYQAMGQADGTYLVIYADRNYSAGSTEFEGADDLAGQTLGAANGNLEAGITDFAGQADEHAQSGAAVGGSGSSDGSSGTSDGGGWLPLGVIAAVGGGGFLLYRRNKRSKERAQLTEVRTALDEDITAYGEQLTALDLDVQTTSAVPIEARQEYGRALDLYEQAKTAAQRAERPDDLQPVTHALEEGRWLLACVDARLKGEEPPERRLPCFFDPRHGPSVEDVEWAPAGGVTRTVPACAADAVRIKDGLDPESRLVSVGDGQMRPYWDAGPAYGGWAGGYFGGFIPGMLWGTMLGSAMSGPSYIDTGAAGGGGGFEGGGGDWGGGGGFDGGGGGWGGGDFGGGFDGGGGW